VVLSLLLVLVLCVGGVGAVIVVVGGVVVGCGVVDVGGGGVGVVGVVVWWCGC